jgi:hypothetical protein
VVIDAVSPVARVLSLTVGAGQSDPGGAWEEVILGAAVELSAMEGQPQPCDERTRDENLLVVAAVEGYSRRHGTPARDTIDLFSRNGILRLIRDSYAALHTQSLDESVEFAEDALGRAGD